MMSRFSGLIDRIRNRERIAAARLFGLAFVPWPQGTVYGNASGGHG
ncbi:hypothetical protein [Mycobacterium uberis]|nr:hypothetical protein [Mycobacterium uberis]